MIEVVEKRSSIGIEDAGKEVIASFDKEYGESGWCIEYSKKGPEYPWQYINSVACTNRNSNGENANINSINEKEIEYEGGVLKIRMTTLKKT